MAPLLGNPFASGRRSRMFPALFALILGLLLVPGCATLQSLTALSQVRFDLDGVSQLRLAGVELDRVRSYDDLSLVDAGRIGAAVLSRRLPMEATLQVGANNPEANPEARLLALDWTLFLRDRETVSGNVEQEFRLAPGARTEVPVRVSLDLLEFFEGSTRDLVDLALALVGAGEESVEVRLDALPTVQTPLGPIQYPRPLSLSVTP